MKTIFTRSTLISGVLALLLTGTLIVALAPTDANALENVTSTQATFKCDDPFDMTVYIAGNFADDDGGGSDQFLLQIVDGDGDIIYSGTQSVPTSSNGTSIYLPLSSLNKEPDSNPIEITVSDNGNVLNAPKIDAPCFDASGEADPTPEEAEEDRGVHRIYANYLDTILYYPGEEGGLEVWYVSPDVVGLFVGRFPKAQLDGSQEPGSTPLETWTWGEDGWLTWSLYYIGNGQYQVNHYIGGVLNFEFIFTP